LCSLFNRPSTTTTSGRARSTTEVRSVMPGETHRRFIVRRVTGPVADAWALAGVGQ